MKAGRWKAPADGGMPTRPVAWFPTRVRTQVKTKSLSRNLTAGWCLVKASSCRPRLGCAQLMGNLQPDHRRHPAPSHPGGSCLTPPSPPGMLRAASPFPPHQQISQHLSPLPGSRQAAPPCSRNTLGISDVSLPRGSWGPSSSPVPDAVSQEAQPRHRGPECSHEAAPRGAPCCGRRTIAQTPGPAPQ